MRQAHVCPQFLGAEAVVIRLGLIFSHDLVHAVGAVLSHGLVDEDVKSWGEGRVFLGSKRPLDDDFLNVAGAFINLAHTHIAVDALDRKVTHITIAA